ncbi:MAG: porin family protein [Candidatus Endonucleobacter bathymodioli]|uniref:Porin family protein n=1 Tax=Candidatus Endonucleibacter bathymodioli TaxID=539814 RepID=A0AA90SDF5_9GAMM|nr:porin family protein [Candidatus Endonucleobacter bathymodioli]
MKKLLIASSLLLSSSVMATGFYAGGQLGAIHGKSDSALSYPALPPNISGSSSSTDLTYGIFGGYRYDLDGFFIAGEIAIGDSKLKTEDSMSLRPAIPVDITIERTQSKPSATINLLAGMPIAEYTEIYGRLGYTEAEFTSKVTAGIGSLPPETALDFVNKRLGYIFGGGAQYHFDDQITMRLDYQYITYKDDNNGLISHTSDNHIVSLGAQYNF